MKKRNWLKISSSIFSLFVVGFISLTTFLAIDSNKSSTNNNSIFNPSLSTKMSRAEKAVSPNVKILNIGDFAPGTPDFNEAKNLALKRIYKRRPSQIQDYEIGTIVQIINSGITTNGVNAPVYTNLTRHQANSILTADDPLECFAGSQTDTALYTPNYLDSIGVIAFKATMWNGNIQLVEYYLVSGFNSEIIPTTLPGQVYQYSVNDLSNSELTTFITFAPKGSPNGYVLPDSRALVPDSRVQNPSDGTISFSLSLTYNVIDAKFNYKDETIMDPNRSQYTIQTNFKSDLSYFGFQPSGNLSTQKLYELIGFILVINVLVILIFAVSMIVIKKVKFKKSL
ncbi:MAG: hypothetical protein RSA40_02370 [Malacoplasma sp.]